MKVVYIAGPFRGPNAWEIEENIRRAERLALQVWRLGAAAICPHSNTRFFDGALEDEVFLRGDIEILNRCDAILMTPDWRRSVGARGEYEHALERGLPIFHDPRDVAEWLGTASEKD